MLKNKSFLMSYQRKKSLKTRRRQRNLNFLKKIKGMEEKLLIGNKAMDDAMKQE